MVNHNILKQKSISSAKYKSLIRIYIGQIKS